MSYNYLEDIILSKCFINYMNRYNILPEKIDELIARWQPKVKKLKQSREKKESTIDFLSRNYQETR